MRKCSVCSGGGSQTVTTDHTIAIGQTAGGVDLRTITSTRPATIALGSSVDGCEPRIRALALLRC